MGRGGRDIAGGGVEVEIDGTTYGGTLSCRELADGSFEVVVRFRGHVWSDRLPYQARGEARDQAELGLAELVKRVLATEG